MKRMLACLWTLTLLLSCVSISPAWQGAGGEEKTNKTKGKTVPKTTATTSTAHGYLIQGQRLYKAEEYAKGVPLLVKAFTLGESVSVPVKHHKGNRFATQTLCDAQLILQKGNLKFSSSCDSGFNVPFNQILIKPEPEKGGRVNLKVVKQDFNLHVTQATMQPLTKGTPVAKLACDNCEAATDALYQLLTQAKQQSAK